METVLDGRSLFFISCSGVFLIAGEWRDWGYPVSLLGEILAWLVFGGILEVSKCHPSGKVCQKPTVLSLEKVRHCLFNEDAGYHMDEHCPQQEGCSSINIP